MSEEPTSPIPTTSPKTLPLPPHNPDKSRRRFIASGAAILVIVIASIGIFSALSAKKGTALAVATTATIPIIFTPTATITQVVTPTLPIVATATVQQGSHPLPTAKPVPTATKPTVSATATPNVIPGGVLFDWSSSSISCGSATQVGHYPSLIVSNGYGDMFFGADILYYDQNGDKNPSYSPVVSPASGIIHGLSRMTLTITDPRATAATAQSSSALLRGEGSYMPKVATNGPVYSITVRFQVTVPNTLTPSLYEEQLNCF